jgi:hypothetical protein
LRARRGFAPVCFVQFFPVRFVQPDIAGGAIKR